VAVATYLNFLEEMAEVSLGSSDHRTFAMQQLGFLLGGCRALHHAIESLIELLDLQPVPTSAPKAFGGGVSPRSGARRRGQSGRPEGSRAIGR
jgi:hypothetical protein